jgi:hypothetical protein
MIAAPVECVVHLLFESDKGKTYHLGNVSPIYDSPLKLDFANVCQERFGYYIDNKLKSTKLSAKKSKFMHSMSYCNNYDNIYEYFVCFSNNQDVKFKIQSYAKGTANIGCGTFRTLIWRYHTSYEILLMLTSPRVLIQIVNHFLARCKEADLYNFEHNILPLPTCQIFYDDIQQKAGCDFYFNTLNDPMPEIFQPVFNNCPKGYFVCNVFREDYPAQLYFVRKKLFKKGSNLQLKDVIRVDKMIQSN